MEKIDDSADMREFLPSSSIHLQTRAPSNKPKEGSDRFWIREGITRSNHPLAAESTADGASIPTLLLFPLSSSLLLFSALLFWLFFVCSFSLLFLF